MSAATKRPSPSKWPPGRLLIALLAGLSGCLATTGVVEIRSKPYPVVYSDEKSEQFADPDEDVFIEVKKAKKTKQLENLAIHYRSFFPDGETVRPGDREEYVQVNGRTAYKVTFRPKYIRKRRRPKNEAELKNPPDGWTVRQMADPNTGESITALYGPVLPQQRILYLVQGDNYLYYVFMRADGDAVAKAKEKFEALVKKDIEYR